MSITFEPTTEKFSAARKEKQITVLSGANNSGKSFVLKHLVALDLHQPYLVGIVRFNNFLSLSSGDLQPVNTEAHKNQMRDRLNEKLNNEANQFNLEQIIKNLNDEKRAKLFSICGELIGNKFSLEHENPQNELSNSFVKVDEENLSISSSGTRLLMTLLGISLNESFTSLYIDEPELGLSPKLQAIVSNYFYSEQYRNEYFSHLKQIVVATHSHLFLDRQDISNNFVVSKDANAISITQIEDMIGFHRLQFNMLGNSFESMFIPSAIVIVEGKTDHKYINRIIELHLADKRVSVISAGDDSQTKRVVNMLKDTFGDLGKSPFRERIFIVLDQVHNQNLKSELERMGVMQDNIVIWSYNGIEYVYPAEILSQVFNCGEDQVSQLSMNNGKIEINGISKTKNELADAVVSALTKETTLPDELRTKLVDPLVARVS
jgi:predicted ATP-dependent endonuclease of OLD family